MTATTFFEISGPDADRLRAFYRGALGLPVGDPDPSGYAMVPPPDGGIGGAIWDGTGTAGSYAVFYVQVDDVDAAVSRVTADGGAVVLAPRPHGPARIAHVTDPAGNRVGLFQWAGQPTG